MSINAVSTQASVGSYPGATMGSMASAPQSVTMPAATFQNMINLLTKQTAYLERLANVLAPSGTYMQKVVFNNAAIGNVSAAISVPGKGFNQILSNLISGTVYVYFGNATNGEPDLILGPTPGPVPITFPFRDGVNSVTFMVPLSSSTAATGNVYLERW